MRKIATLALAAALSIAAIAPAAFAKPADCTGKDFAASMKIAAQDKSHQGRQQKNAWASTNCAPAAETPPVEEVCIPISMFIPTCKQHASKNSVGPDFGRAQLV